MSDDISHLVNCWWSINGKELLFNPSGAIKVLTSFDRLSFISLPSSSSIVCRNSSTDFFILSNLPNGNSVRNVKSLSIKFSGCEWLAFDLIKFPSILDGNFNALDADVINAANNVLISIFKACYTLSDIAILCLNAHSQYTMEMFRFSLVEL